MAFADGWATSPEEESFPDSAIAFRTLEDVPLADQTELIVGPFMVPMGVSLDFELWIENTSTSTPVGATRRASSFSPSMPAGAVAWPTLHRDGIPNDPEEHP